MEGANIKEPFDAPNVKEAPTAPAAAAAAVHAKSRE